MNKTLDVEVQKKDSPEIQKLGSAFYIYIIAYYRMSKKACLIRIVKRLLGHTFFLF